MEINKKHFIQVFLTCLILVVICEFIGQRTIAIGKASIVLFPMLYAVIIGLIITPDLLGKKIKSLKKVIGEKEINIAGEVVGIALVMLGIKYGTTVGPNIDKIIQAGPAFIAQEFGHILAPIVALPLALIFGMKREAVGATASISREPSLGVISEKYGINSPEGSGVLGTYLMGTVLGTIYFSVLGSISIYSGLHPYALGMACGVGSGSMMTAAAGSLSTMVSPEMADTILAYAATSNMMSSITGIIFLVFVSLPFTNFMYKILEPKFSRNKKTKEIKSTEGEC
ncbi:MULTISPECIES: DUF3100 domain-containing protein [unclassified Clostridioides]|uniref:DUF3100 domain-containing protein n=1 Tax=unclassified Clostridioides TaxID=2635829 RepID=UPI001D11C8D0|nr:DUF3100 domain-containing protein [Clostridioides sp. ES-S-0171-01]MCC0686545.1 DUF3100 domain-containing protein [Clostridioides sp. ES-S-0056-01]MCC0713935.1 DUF3100 domain-containing protein [Clostridioides sp. ES-S-0077-01]UDN55131.1 DUF3100 domain-containing protein [Clostridioides sp. ES-S-0054-01]